MTICLPRTWAGSILLASKSAALMWGKVAGSIDVSIRKFASILPEVPASIAANDGLGISPVITPYE